MGPPEGVAYLDRQPVNPSTGTRTNGLEATLVALVSAHLVVAIVHGIAHQNANVLLAPAGTAFVVVVILLAPLVGLALTRVRPRGGAALVAVSMVGALLFGIVNHFVLAGPDHVSQVDPRWRILFAATAVILALTEVCAAIAAGLAASKAPR